MKRLKSCHKNHNFDKEIIMSNYIKKKLFVCPLRERREEITKKSLYYPINRVLAEAVLLFIQCLDYWFYKNNINRKYSTMEVATNTHTLTEDK